MKTELYTEKIYYADSHLFSFTADVLQGVSLEDGRCTVILDRTAFFPEGGGQPADTGWIGDARVLDVHEKNGMILHYLDKLPSVWEDVPCRLDAEQRLRRMQNHSGEHVVSGLVHKNFGYENVGFHMGKECMTLDFSGELSREQMLDIERQANEAVRKNIPVVTSFPSQEVLETLVYRSKLELTENVRIVEIEGVDRCACCAPHVCSTGEIGVIKVLSCERHRGGVRVELICGMDALDNFNARQKSAMEISNMLSAKRAEIAEAVEHLITERNSLKVSLAAAETALIRMLAASRPEKEGNDVLINPCGEMGISLSEIARRELVNLIMPKCSGLVAVLQGSDEDGYQYIIGSTKLDLRKLTKEINAAIAGRGGGKSEMITGRCTAPAEEIRKYFA